MKYIKLLIITLFIIFTSSHAQEIYKWVDENGKVHFGDRKPDTQNEVEALNIKLINSVETVTYQPSSIDVGKKVVIYTTSWCGYCKKAKKYFGSKRIRYTEKNIEKSKIAKMEFDKLGGKGVPVILVGKKRMSGFSEAGFERIYSP
ncbi:glutaredoxin family protein [Colwellia sp. RSH04]|uniref:glutaredoxin family protein n=1 Tax=Colwellia sp. RSH04 TaxID=2305464 RepID=UPI000E5943DA|nr:glutaredoxin family protein [Colwellia sp. RSH04]RHW76126.1 glutaredoxin family protein [Colwellia sp. RSH04]